MSALGEKRAWRTACQSAAVRLCTHTSRADAVQWSASLLLIAPSLHNSLRHNQFECSRHAWYQAGSPRQLPSGAAELTSVLLLCLPYTTLTAIQLQPKRRSCKEPEYILPSNHAEVPWQVSCKHKCPDMPTCERRASSSSFSRSAWISLRASDSA